MKKSNRFYLSIMAFSLSSAIHAAGGNGMTWATHSHDNSLGIDKVSCSNCNAYQGETSCKVSLPVLCTRIDNAPRPAYTATPSEYYDGWSGGHIATTMPVQGTSLSTATTGDQLCRATFGDGWRMAEFHDGNGGWSFRAYGYIRNDQRFWVRINDQPANCWNP